MRSLFHRSFYYYFLLSFAVLFFWFLGQWPGLFSFDTLLLIQDINEGKFHSGWNSYIFSNLVTVFHGMTPNLSSLGFFNVISLSFFLGLSFSWFHSQKVSFWWITPFFLWLVYTPQLGIFTFSYEREYFTVWLGILTYWVVFVDLFQRHKTGVDPSFKKNVFLSLLLCIFAMIKQDSIFSILAFSIIYYFNFKNKKTFFSQFLPILFLISLIVNIILPLTLKAYPLSRVYLTTALINPVKYILQNVSIDDKVSPQDLRNLSKIVDVKHLVADKNFYDIGALWVNGKHQSATASDFNDFKSSALKLIVSHPVLFFTERIRLFLYAAGFSKHSKYQEDQLVVPVQKQRLKSVLRNNQIMKQPLFTGWLSFQTRWHKYHSKAGLNLRHLAFASLAFFFVVMAFFFFLFVRFKFFYTGAVVFLAFSKYLVVFLCAPAAYYKYYFGLYILALYLPAMMAVEFKLVKKALHN